MAFAVARQGLLQCRDKSRLLAAMLALGPPICHRQGPSENSTQRFDTFRASVGNPRNGTFMQRHGLCVLPGFAVDDAQLVAQLRQVVLLKVHERWVASLVIRASASWMDLSR